MNRISKYDCYIEEYHNGIGMCARLRDKTSNKIVSLTGGEVDKIHFLTFLSQAKINEHIMPTVFRRDGDDTVAVRGILASESDDEIIVSIDCETGGYIFE